MSWLAEDPELLRAALEIIDTWDDVGGDGGTDKTISVHSPLTDGSDSASDDHDRHGADDSGEDVMAATTPSSLVVTIRPPPLDPGKPRSRADASSMVAKRELKPSTVASTRHRRREEIIYLRDKVKAMESQLALLEQNKKDAEAAKREMASADGVLTAMWHDVATRQQRLRQKSELDQAKLRELLETQLKVADGLMKLMQKARRMEEDEVLLQPKRMRLTGSPRNPLDEGEQIARLHASYDNLDAAFAFPKFHDGSLKFVDIEVTDELEEEAVIEYREAWTVPFETDCVLDALWQYTLKKNKEKWRAPDIDSNTTLQRDGTELVSRFSARSTIGGFAGSFNGQAIVKRFAGNGDKPPAILSVMNTKPEPVEPGDIEGFYMRDDGFIRVLPVSIASREVGNKHISIVQCVQRFELRFEDEAQNVRHGSGALTNMILDKLKDDIELKHSTVETLLLCSKSR